MTEWKDKQDLSGDTQKKKKGQDDCDQEQKYLRDNCILPKEQECYNDQEYMQFQIDSNIPVEVKNQNSNGYVYSEINNPSERRDRNDQNNIQIDRIDLQKGQYLEQQQEQFIQQSLSPSSRSAAITSEVNSDIQIESYLQKEFVENLQEFSPISKLEDSRADVTAYLFDSIIANGKKKLINNHSPHPSSFGAKVQQIQMHESQQADQKNQKLRERFEKFSNQMKDNITKNKSDSLHKPAQMTKGNSKNDINSQEQLNSNHNNLIFLNQILQADCSSNINGQQQQQPQKQQIQQNQEGNIQQSIQHNQMKQQIPQLPLTNYSKPTVSSTKKAEAVKTERGSQGNKTHQKRESQQGYVSKGIAKGNVNNNQQLFVQSKQPIILLDSNRQQYAPFGTYLVPSPSCSSGSKNYEQKYLTSREQYSHETIKGRSISQRTLSEIEDQKMRKSKEVQQEVEDQFLKQLTKSMQEQDDEEGNNSPNNNDQINNYQTSDKKEHDDQDDECFTINIYKQGNHAKRSCSKGDNNGQINQKKFYDISQQPIQRSQSAYNNNSNNNYDKSTSKVQNYMDKFNITLGEQRIQDKLVVSAPIPVDNNEQGTEQQQQILFLTNPMCESCNVKIDNEQRYESNLIQQTGQTTTARSNDNQDSDNYNLEGNQPEGIFKSRRDSLPFKNIKHLEMNKINIKTIMHKNQGEIENNQNLEEEEEYSERISNRSPISKRNQSLVSIEDATISDMHASPLKTGIIPRILHIQQLIEENNNDSQGSFDLNEKEVKNKEEIVDKDQIRRVSSEQQRHFQIGDDIKITENDRFNEIKTARQSIKTKKDLNVVIKRGSSKEISAKSSPRVVPLSSCKVKKKDLIPSPGKKTSQNNIVYLCKDQVEKQSSILKQGVQNVISINGQEQQHQQQYFIAREGVIQKKVGISENKESEMLCISNSKQIGQKVNKGNISQQSNVQSPTEVVQKKPSFHKISLQLCDDNQQQIAAPKQIVSLKNNVNNNNNNNSGSQASTFTTIQNCQSSTPNNMITVKEIFGEEGEREGNLIKKQSSEKSAKRNTNAQIIPQLSQYQIMQLQVQQPSPMSSQYAQQFQQKQAEKGIIQKEIIISNKDKSQRQSSNSKIQQEQDIIDRLGVRKRNTGNLRGSTKDEQDPFQRITQLSKNLHETNNSITKYTINTKTSVPDNPDTSRSELKTLQDVYHNTNTDIKVSNTSNNNNGIKNNLEKDTYEFQILQAASLVQQQQQTGSQTDRSSISGSQQLQKPILVQTNTATSIFTPNSLSKQSTASNSMKPSYSSDISASSSSRGYCSSTHYEQSNQDNINNKQNNKFMHRYHKSSIEENIIQSTVISTHLMENQVKSVQNIINNRLQPQISKTRSSNTFQSYTQREAMKANYINNNTNKSKNQSEVNNDLIMQHLLDGNKNNNNTRSSSKQTIDSSATNSTAVGVHSRQTKSTASSTYNQNGNNNSNKNYEALKASLQKYNSNQSSVAQKIAGKKVISPSVISDTERDQLNLKIQLAEQEIAHMSKFKNRYSSTQKKQS